MTNTAKSSLLDNYTKFDSWNNSIMALVDHLAHDCDTWKNASLFVLKLACIKFQTTLIGQSVLRSWTGEIYQSNCYVYFREIKDPSLQIQFLPSISVFFFFLESLLFKSVTSMITKQSLSTLFWEISRCT